MTNQTASSCGASSWCSRRCRPSSSPVGIFLLGVMVGRGVPAVRQPAAVVALEDVDPLVPSPAIPPEDALPVGQDDGPRPNATYQDELFSDGASEGRRVKVPRPSHGRSRQRPPRPPRRARPPR
jgi:hypothetical protein